ncbi:iron ABC transporter permease [Desulfobacula sp.]|uniref:ABC transporter permease n=1 Tax=Desulfobacula sp. TaxID=2593537 RepID=UPI002601796A|nr:iron ABC transporter permease [Desulfobacula sp.]
MGKTPHHPVNTRHLLLIILPFVLFILSPLLFLLTTSVVDDTGQLTLEHLKILAVTSRQLGLIKNSLLLAGSTSLATVLIGVPLAFFIHRTDIWCKKCLAAVCLVPLLLPPYIQALLWTGVSVPYIHTLAGGVFIFTLSFFPFVTIITGSGLQATEGLVEEAALMARGRLATIWNVTLPLVAPHITAGAIIVFVFTIINFEVPDILRITVYPVEIFIHFSAYYDEKTATLLSLPLIGLTMALIWWQMMVMRNKSYIALGFSRTGQPIFSLGRLRMPCFIGLLSMVTLCVILPLGVLIKGAGGMETYIKAFQSSRDHIYYSVAVAGASALIMTGFSFIVSYYLVRTRGWISTGLDYLIQLSLGIPSIVLGIGMIHVWNREWTDSVYTSTWILIFAFVSGYSPFVVKVVSAKISQIHPEWEEVAIMGTGSRIRTLLGIVLPLATPGLMAGFFIGFILSLFNLGTALLVVPPGKGTLPISIYNFMHYGAMETVYAQSLILIAIAVTCGGILYLVYRLGFGGKIRT